MLDKYLPLKKITKKEFKQRFKPWITSGIQKSIKIRDKFLKLYIKSKNIYLKENYHKIYKTYRNQIVSLTKQSKKNHYQNYFTVNYNNIKKTWDGIKSIINISNNKSAMPSMLNNNNKTITNPTKIANQFNDFFSSIGSKLQNNIQPSKNNPSYYLKNPNYQKFFINPSTETEIQTLISNLNNGKSTGPFSIPTNILKLINSNVSLPLSKIINLSFETGIYPENLKIAKVIPIFKNKGSSLDCNNYRPISLLSNINKLFEKLMHSRLYNFLNINNCFYNLQFGFREKHSTMPCSLQYHGKGS